MLGPSNIWKKIMTNSFDMLVLRCIWFQFVPSDCPRWVCSIQVKAVCDRCRALTGLSPYPAQVYLDMLSWQDRDEDVTVQERMQWVKLKPWANTSTFCTPTSWYKHVQTHVLRMLFLSSFLSELLHFILHL